jgi:hypothetical protein
MRPARMAFTSSRESSHLAVACEHGKQVPPEDGLASLSEDTLCHSNIHYAEVLCCLLSCACCQIINRTFFTLISISLVAAAARHAYDQLGNFSPRHLR